MADDERPPARRTSVQDGVGDFFSRPHMQRLREDIERARANVDPQHAAFLEQAKQVASSPRMRAIADALRNGVSGQQLWRGIREQDAQPSTPIPDKKRRGRPPRSLQQAEEENALIDEVLALLAAGVDLRFAEQTVAPKLKGSGTLDSKMTRLRKLRTDRR